ncbi:MAG: HD domain-containing protein [Deltaproteobacteria bacterium]|nr:HD domain-containing protein [Deltaproteobacteria bacterium]
MAKLEHEIRDPIHVFIKLSSDERKVLNSRPFQRLRHIHQLAMTFLVYPGATHRRFEHSLGVMELASRIFDIVTNPNNVTDEIRRFVPEIAEESKRSYWRRVIRMAGLCHDLGHLPFSHAAEKELLPQGTTHETLTAKIIRSDEMCRIWNEMTPPLRPDDIVKLAVGPKEAAEIDPELQFTTWEDLLSDIIVGNAFGADRIDYLLRDAHHAGVAYGKFDHYRLIDTLRILPAPPADEGNGSANPEPSIGVEEGGVHAAEALLLARHFMFTQLYLHPVRRAYDIHLKDFLKEWLENGKFSTDVEEHLQVTDNEVMAGILKAARNEHANGHDAAKRIVERTHFRCLYEWNPDDIAVNPEAGNQIFEAAATEFGEPGVRRDEYSKTSPTDFPVKAKDERIISFTSVSDILRNALLQRVDLVFIDPCYIQRAREWLSDNRASIITPPTEDDDE